MSTNPILDQLQGQNPEELPTEQGPRGVSPLPLNVPSSQVLQDQLRTTEDTAAQSLQNVQGTKIEAPEYTGPTSVPTGNRLQDPSYLTQQAQAQFQRQVDWMDQRNGDAQTRVPVFSENLALPQLQELPTRGVVNPGNLGALAAKRDAARSAFNTGVYYGPGGSSDGRGGVVLPENMEQYGPAIDSIIHQNRARGSTPDPTPGVATESVRGVLGLLRLAGNALLGAQRGGARAVQQARTGSSSGALNAADWVGGVTLGGLGLVNQEGRKAWMSGFKEQMSGMSAMEREALLQLTPTKDTGRKGFGDYGSHALGFANYALDNILSFGNQARASIAARVETNIWQPTPFTAADRAKLAEATRRNAQAAFKGKDFSFLNPDSPLTPFRKDEKNPTWWKTGSRTVAGVFLDTITGGPDITDLVSGLRRGVTRAASKTVPSALPALPPGKAGGALVAPNRAVTLYPTPVQRTVPNAQLPSGRAPLQLQGGVDQAPLLLPRRQVLPDPWNQSPTGPLVARGTSDVIDAPHRTVLALPGTVEPLRPDPWVAPKGPLPDPWATPLEAPLTKPRLPGEPLPEFQRISPYNPIRADQFTPEADPWGDIIRPVPQVQVVNGTFSEVRALPPSTRGGSVAINRVVPDPWETPQGPLPPMTFAARYNPLPNESPTLDLNRMVPLLPGDSVPNFGLPYSSGIGKVDDMPYLARPWTPDTQGPLPAPTRISPERWELYQSDDLYESVDDFPTDDLVESIVDRAPPVREVPTPDPYDPLPDSPGDFPSDELVADIVDSSSTPPDLEPAMQRVTDANNAFNTAARKAQEAAPPELQAKYYPDQPQQPSTALTGATEGTPDVVPRGVDDFPSDELVAQLVDDPFVRAVRESTEDVLRADPDAPQKVLTHAFDAGTLHVTKGGGVVSAPDAIRSAQYKLIDLRIRQRSLTERARSTATNALLQDQLLEEAAGMQEVINELRRTITGGRGMRKQYANALTPEEIDRVVPVIPMDVVDPKPTRGPDFVNRMREAPPPQTVTIALGSSAELTSRSAEDLSALARLLGHTQEVRPLSWDELAKLNAKHGLYNAIGPAVPRDAIDRAVATGVGRLEVAKGTVGTPQVSMIVRNTPRVLNTQYNKAVTKLADYVDQLPSPQAWAALTKMAPMSDADYMSLIDTWVASDGRGALRRNLNPVLRAYPPTESNYAALVSKFADVDKKGRAKLPKPLRELLEAPVDTVVKAPNDVSVAVTFTPPAGTNVVANLVPDAPLPVVTELAKAPQAAQIAQDHAAALSRATDAREGLVELEAQLVTLQAQANASRAEVHAAPAIEPRSLLDATYEGGTLQQEVVDLFEQVLDYPELRGVGSELWETSSSEVPDVVWYGSWHGGRVGLPSEVDASRGAVPPGWRLVSTSRDNAELAATARLHANNILADVEYQPGVIRYSMAKGEPVVRSIDAKVPADVRGAIAAILVESTTGKYSEVGQRLARVLTSTDVEMTLNDVLRLFEKDHITVSPTAPLDEAAGAHYNAALFQVLADEVDLIDVGSGNYLVPHNKMGSALTAETTGGVPPTPVPGAPTKTGVTPLTTRLRELSTKYWSLLNNKETIARTVSEEQAQYSPALGDGIQPGEWSIASRLSGAADALEQGKYLPLNADEFTFINDIPDYAPDKIPEAKRLMREALGLYNPTPQQAKLWGEGWNYPRYTQYPEVQRMVSMAASVDPRRYRGKVQPDMLPVPSATDAAARRFALDSLFTTPPEVASKLDDVVDYVSRTANIDQLLQEQVQAVTDAVNTGGTQLDEALAELDRVTEEATRYFEDTRKVIAERRAAQQRVRVEAELADIDEFADPRCL